MYIAIQENVNSNLLKTYLNKNSTLGLTPSIPFGKSLHFEFYFKGFPKSFIIFTPVIIVSLRQHLYATTKSRIISYGRMWLRGLSSFINCWQGLDNIFVLRPASFLHSWKKRQRQQRFLWNFPVDLISSLFLSYCTNNFRLKLVFSLYSLFHIYAFLGSSKSDPIGGHIFSGEVEEFSFH